MLIPAFQHARPQNVELLLNAERPKMPKNPRLRVVVVRQVEESSCDMVPGHLMPVHNYGDDKEHERRGNDPVSSANIKLAEIDGPSSNVFTEQNARDQITRNDKEDTYSGISDRRPRERSGKLGEYKTRGDRWPQFERVHRAKCA